jgi:hypothetical protein
MLSIADSASGSAQTVTLSGAGQDFTATSSGTAGATVMPGQTAAIPTCRRTRWQPMQEPIYLASFMRALLVVGVDANDQNLLQTRAPFYNAFIGTYGRAASYQAILSGKNSETRSS